MADFFGLPAREAVVRRRDLVQHTENPPAVAAQEATSGNHVSEYVFCKHADFECMIWPVKSIITILIYMNL